MWLITQNISQNISYMDNLSLSLSLLTCPSCIAIMHNIGGWSSLPGEESRSILITVPNGLRSTLYLPPAWPPPKRLWLCYGINPSPSSTPPLLSLCLKILLYRLPPPPSMAACPALIPSISRAGCFHHHLDSYIPEFRSAAKHKSIIGIRRTW